MMPFLDNLDLVHFYQLNQLTKTTLTPVNGKCIHFDVLFKMQKRGYEEEAYKSL